MLKKWIAFLFCTIPLLSFAQSIDLLILNKNYSEALSQIETRLNASPNAELYFKQGTIYRQLSNPLYAKQSIEQSVALDSTNSKYLAEYADLLTELGNPVNAIPYYQKATLYSPEDFNLKYKLGKAFMTAENFQKAYDVFTMIRFKDSTNVVYNKQLGITAFRLGKFEQAICMFESVLDINPYDLSAYQNLIALYSMSRDAVHLIRTSDRALYFFPNNSGILLREANSLFTIKQYDEAIIPYETYLATNDSVYEVLKNYGFSLYFIQENVKSRKILEKSFELNPNDPILTFYLGLVCRKLSDLPACIEYLNMAISDIKGSMTEMYHCLGQVHGLEREFEKSIEALQEAYECNPDKTEYLVEIARTCEEYTEGKKLALKYYTKYLTEAGDSALNAKYAKERIEKIKGASPTDKRAMTDLSQRSR